MSFKTAAEMFGNGGGFGPAVPYSTTNAPGTSAGNRGVQFGEQLTAAIANRTHYALALNDEDLNTRLASFESGGLDSAYDLGTLAVPGGGRAIAKDGGAVETASTLASLYGDDRANAHFRANAYGDLVRGGGGFDFRGTAGSLAQVYGFLDRRALDFAGNTTVSGTVALTLNPGGALPTDAGIGAGVLTTAGNTDLTLGFDLLEVLSGAHAGLYLIAAVPTATRATLLKLDGSAPSFGANVATTGRIFRPRFITSSVTAGTPFDGVTILGDKGGFGALNLIPTGTQGRFGVASPDGAPYALVVKPRTAVGSASTPVTGIDGLGRLEIHTNTAQLTATQAGAGLEFGQAGVWLDHNGDITSSYLSGVVVRATGARNAHYGVAAIDQLIPPTTPGGTINFTFGGVAGHIVSADTVAVDNHVSPGSSLVEILTPSAQKGIYIVSAAGIGTGDMTLLDLGENLTVGFPVVGVGTFRFLTGTILGNRVATVETPASTLPSVTRAAAIIQAPGHANSTGLLLTASNDGGSAFIRAVEAGLEVAAVRADGTIVGENYTYRNTKSRSVRLSNAGWRPYTTTGTAHWEIDGGFPALYEWGSRVNSGRLFFPLSNILPTEGNLTDVQVAVYANPGGGGNIVTLTLYRHAADLTTGAGNPIAPSSVATVSSGAGAGKVVLSLAGALGAGHSIAKFSYDYILVVTAGAGAAANPDLVYGARAIFDDPGPRIW